MKYKWKTRPYKHQVEAVLKLLEQEHGGALFMAPRTGKTKTAIDYASIQHQRGLVNRVLVVAPVSVLGVWRREISAHCGFRRRVVVWDRKARKDMKLPPWGSDVLDFVIVNPDAFSTPGAITGRTKEGTVLRSNRRGGRYDIKKALLKWQPQLIILDESHRIKKPSARKTTMLWSLGAIAPYRVIMTGTPITKKHRIHDLYAQWKFLNPESPILHYRDEEGKRRHHTAESFKQEYGRWVKLDNYSKWTGNRNFDRLLRMVQAEAYSIRREECFDLPPRTEQVIPVDLTDRSWRIYNEMVEEMVAQLENGEITEASIPLVQSLRLAQISSGIAKTPEGKLVRFGNEKLLILEELLADFFEAGEKVVVAARFKDDIAQAVAIAKKLKAPVWELHGGIPQRQRDISIEAFRRRQGEGLFVMQPQAGSLGIDLSTSSIFIWLSLTTSFVDFTQSEDRIALSPHPCTYMYLTATPAEQVMYESLLSDGNIAKAITRNPKRLLRTRD